jgi:2,3-bisphosphoglycerate-independent phosphoglycerate mutase
MDGVGVRKEHFGNAVALAATPALHFLKQAGLYTTLKASGPAVGLPSEQDMGNSEVGHNAIGAGRIFDQGAKLVNAAIAEGSLFKGETWKKVINQVLVQKSTLHFLGLLSDGNVHSHEGHLHALIREAVRAGVKRIRIHTLLDGRDVGAHSAETYAARLLKVLGEAQDSGCDAQVASGGGRMHVTMDRYEADWGVVERGWKAHVLGEGEFSFPSLESAIKKFRENPSWEDQYLPSFVIVEKEKPIGTIEDGDAVILFNFRGDRAIQISKAFEEENFSAFERRRYPKILFAGLLEYDGDLHIPKHYLVTPPLITNTFGEYLCSQGLRQFACSETQKYGHVTYFWNGNRSGYFDKSLEEYVEIPSDRIAFHLKPWMKAHEITEATIQRMHANSFDYGRINYANGDMVGHTGDLESAIVAVATVDMMIKRLIIAAQKTGCILLVTSDHGNCDEMFESNPIADDSPYPQLWQRPKAKTSHTLAEVPCYIYDPVGAQGSVVASGHAGLANIANTVLELMGLPSRSLYEPSLWSK